MNRTAMFLLVCVATLPADALDRKQTEHLATEYANCAGFWDAMAIMSARSGKPASSELTKNTGNGAELTALWLLAKQHHDDHPDDKRTLGSFSPMVEPRREAAQLATFALAEHGDLDELKRDDDRCTMMLKFQDEVLTSIRRNAADAKSKPDIVPLDPESPK